ncbi:MAG: hypothetical protein QOI03_1275 [Solirubrobacteraceae bacterium]|nr:hypothetical protein [Solirubrobacteraceae bacterium]
MERRASHESLREWTTRRPAALALLGYLLLAAALLGRTWLGGNLNGRLVGVGGDPWGFVWFLAWLPHALGHGHSPLFTTLLMAPQGANLLNSTSILLPSLLLWPITAGFGPVVSYDVLALIALAASAWAAYFALRRITPHRSSAWAGGAVYGFGGYMAGQATAHVNLLIAVFPPVAAMLVDDLRRSRSPVRTGAALGACSAAQVFVNEEILATTAILLALALGLAAWMLRPARPTVVRYVQGGAAAATVFGILAGPALIYQLAGPEHVSGLLVSSGKYVNDLAGFVVPNRVQWLSTAGSRQLTDGFSGFDGEYGSYLGVALIALLVWAGYRLRRRALPVGLLLLVAAVFSLGPHLRVWGHDTGIFLPWIIPNHLPLLENVVPSRFNLYVWLAVGALLALLIDDLRCRPLLGRKSLGWAVCAIALIPAVPALTPSRVLNVPAAVGSASEFRALAPGARTVLITPFLNGQFAMYAQARAGFAYRIPDGSVFVPGSGGPAYGLRHGPILYALAALDGVASTRAGRTRADSLCVRRLTRRDTLSTQCRSLYLVALRALRVDAVVVCDYGPRWRVRRYLAFFTALLGASRRTVNASVFSGLRRF